MRKTLTLTALAFATALGFVLSTAPAGAQVAGNPGDQHSATTYTTEQWSGHPVGGPDKGPFAPLEAMGTGLSAPKTAPQSGCRAFQDFNGRYTSVCAP